jgi:eukaryotic-like serine/threonine-protein kinase
MPVLTTQDRLGMTVADKYRLDRVLGEGGMGVVYAGHHLKLDLPVAVKFLHPQYSRSPDVVERFLREARATSRLIHPNVVQVRDVDVASEDGSVYMVLELLSGKSLAGHLEEQKVLSVDETLAILLPVIDALAAAHDLGIVHRDIKPDNVFLCRSADGRITPKVLDFGIAKLTAGGSSPSATATGAIMGTALYMAPEQAMGRGKEIGPASDVWSTAVMAYECLTGTFPFEIDLSPEMNAMAVMMATVTAPMVPLVNRRSELIAMSTALERALDRNVGARTPTMRALADDLRNAAAGVSPEVKQSRVLSVRPPAGRITTGPLEDPAAKPAPGAPHDLTPEQVVPRHAPVTRAAADSFARTALPDGAIAPPGAMTAGTASGISHSAMMSAGLPASPRSLVPYAIGAIVAVALVAGGAIAATSMSGPTPAASTSAPAVSPPAAAATSTASEPPAVHEVAHEAPPALGVAGEPAVGAALGTEVVEPPVGAEIPAIATHAEGGRARPGRGGAREPEASGARAEPTSTGGAGGTRGASSESGGGETPSRGAGGRTEGSGGEAASSRGAEGSDGRAGDHRAGGLSVGEF